MQERPVGRDHGGVLLVGAQIARFQPTATTRSSAPWGTVSHFMYFELRRRQFPQQLGDPVQIGRRLGPGARAAARRRAACVGSRWA